ncbi:MAG: type II toxin-antitoxin system ParD family antitoxin [Pseudomonadota bacterium]
MASISISLPEQMKTWVREKSRNGHYNDVSDYIRDLIRKDQEREKKRVALQDLWREGLESPQSSRTLEEIYDDALVRHLKSD